MTNSTVAKVGGVTGSLSAGEGQPIRLVKLELDISKVAALVTTGGYATLMTIPADTYFKFYRAEVVTAVSLDSSSSGRIDIGDSGSLTIFVSNQTTFTAGADMTIAAETGSSGPCYTAADELRIKLTGDKLSGGTANATGIIRVVIAVGDVSRLAPMTNQA